ncbi:MAG: hypothetical protein WCI36_00710 [bacterium]
MFKKNKTFFNNKKQGSILAYSLIVLGMMLSIAVAISSSTIIEKKSASATSSSVQSLQTADSGAQLAIKTINAGSNLTSVINTIPVFSTCDNGVIKNLSIPGAGRYDLYLYSDLAAMVPIICNTSKGNDVKIIKSVATYNGTARSVSVKVGVDCTGTVSKDGITYGKVLAEDGRCWLDRNLGAKDLPTSATDDAGYGWYFQWGRKADGHQYTAWGGQPSPALSSSVMNNLAIIVNHEVQPPYNTYFLGADGNPALFSKFDWLPDTLQDNSLWDLTSSNNPCPSGFRVPTQQEFAQLLNSAGLYGCNTNCIVPAFNSKLKFVSAGYRGNAYASIERKGEVGYFWTVSPPFSHEYQMFWTIIDNNQIGAGPLWRYFGLSLRCIAD